MGAPHGTVSQKESAGGKWPYLRRLQPGGTYFFFFFAAFFVAKTLTSLLKR